MRISVIIPSLNEAAHITAAIKSAADRNSAFSPSEIIVADGGSTDGTREVAAASGARVIEAPKGRAVQMNTGAEAASGGIFLFLHADTLLPKGYDMLVRSAASLPATAAGAFTLKFNKANRGMTAIESLANWRSRRLGMPYGDQAIFMRADIFSALGGFKEMPIMEDFELMRRARRFGDIITLPVPALTSGRRFHKLGVLRAALINQAVILGYLAGVQPERLAEFYKSGDKGLSDVIL
ncbi:MAG: TIGR04283 family arsenosugar biosynthesis glycosyltransferase [Nitrospirota bacterium]